LSIELPELWDMRLLIIHYIVVLTIFLAIDFAWLSTAGRTLYVAEIGGLLRDRPNFAVAFAFYAVFALGLLLFVVEAALPSSTIARAMMWGGFFGLVAYATYDLTNLATMKGFTARIALIDMAWGAALSAAVSGLSLLAIRSLKL
jgi:uncharacterized membrane protein